MARHIEQSTGHPCVPVFWLEGEDHDFEEAASINIPTGSHLRTVRLEAEPQSGALNTGPVGRIGLGEQIDRLISEVEDALPPTDFRASVIDCLHDCYQPDATLRDAFARLMRRLFTDHGLVFVSPDNTPWLQS